MHGIFFHFLKEYMQETYGGKETWSSLLIASGYAYKVYFPVKEYPDEELTTLIQKSCMLLDIPEKELTIHFGEFLAPRLLQFYSMYIKDKNWRSLELMQNMSSDIHQAIIRRNPDTKPPDLFTKSLNKDHLTLHYQSPRKLCVMLSGMIRGLAHHYDDQLVIHETECMLQGAEECVFDIQRNT